MQKIDHKNTKNLNMKITFVLKMYLDYRELLITGLLTVERWLQGDEYKWLDFLNEREVTKAKREI